MSRPRIIGGSAKGRAIETPRRGTRPSPARLREALFDIVAFEPRGRFLDLYAGSGAVGLEAASRGFDVVCVELAKEAAAVIARNARSLGLPVRVVRGDALAYAAEHPGQFDVVFAAPPYPLDLREAFLGVLASGAARPGGVYVLQHPTGFAPALPPGLEGAPARLHRYGSNALTVVRVPAR
ncbi:MAG TPA: RsmD family RNA methyltransferase [Trueperaceae bacterium]